MTKAKKQIEWPARAAELNGDMTTPQYQKVPADPALPPCAGCVGEHDQVLCSRLPVVDCIVEDIVWKEKDDDKPRTSIARADRP